MCGLALVRRLLAILTTPSSTVLASSFVPIVFCEGMHFELELRLVLEEEEGISRRAKATPLTGCVRDKTRRDEDSIYFLLPSALSPFSTTLSFPRIHLANTLFVRQTNTSPSRPPCRQRPASSSRSLATAPRRRSCRFSALLMGCCGRESFLSFLARVAYSCFPWLYSLDSPSRLRD
jgi:hypothetical protein